MIVSGIFLINAIKRMVFNMVKITKDWIEAYFEYGIDQNNRRIFLVGDIDQDVANNVAKSIYLMESCSKEKPITIHIYTDGGCEYAMFAIYDAIKQCSCDIETVAMGNVMSAGPLLVAAGTKGKRCALPNSWFMIHESADDWGYRKVSNNENLLKHYSKLQERWLKLMENVTGTPKKVWQRMCNGHDKYFDATKAVELGIVDFIWDENAEDEQ